MKTKGVGFLVVGLLVFAAGTPLVAAEVTQTTGSGSWCSPAQNGNGNTVNCNGVDPRAMDRLNELLDRIDLNLKEKTAKANDWGRRYNELNTQLEEVKKQLATKGENATLALVQTAQDLLHEGKLDEARAIFDRLIQSDEANVDRAAQDFFGRGTIFALQFRLDEALPDYAKAYQYRPDDQRYAEAYAYALQKVSGTQSIAGDVTQTTGSGSLCSPAQNGNGNTSICNFGLTPEQLKPVTEAAVTGATAPLTRQIVEISKTLGVTEDAAKTLLKIVGEDPNIPDDKLAGVLTKVASDYKRLQAQVAALNPDNPTARSLVDQAKSEIDAGRLERAHELLHQATQTQIAAAQEARKLREQAQAAEDAQMLGAANSIAAEGAIYRTLRQYDEAGKLYRQAIEIEEKILGPTPQVAARYNNLGELYLGWGKFQEAESMLNHSIEMHEKSGQNNSNLIVPLSNLGQLYWATYRYPEAEAAYKRALAIGEKALSAKDPSLVRTRLNYAQLLDRLGRGAEADKLRE